MNNLLKNIPIPTAGLAVALVSLGNLLQPYSDLARIVLACLSFALIALLTARIVRYPHSVVHDFRSSIFASVFGTFFMTIMQLSVFLIPLFPIAAFAIWVAAIAGHMTLIVWFSIRLIGHFSLDDVFPTYFVAYVGIVVASVTAPNYGLESYGEAIFWFGFSCYMVLLVVVTVRYARIETPEPAKPIFCIYAAPMSLCLTGYLSCAQNPNIVFVCTMAVLSQLLLVLVLTKLPCMLRLRFYPSCAAMTFPFVITATALGKTIDFLSGYGIGVAGLQVLQIVEIAYAAFMVLYVLIKYLAFFHDLATVKPYGEKPSLVKNVE